MGALICSVIVIAQKTSLSGGLYKHVIDVEAYNDWGKGYLTVIDNHLVAIAGDIDGNNYHLTAFEPVLIESGPRDPETGELIITGEMIPDIGSVIYKVNGISTFRMTPEQFYQITDTATIFTLQYETEDRDVVEYSFYRYSEFADIIHNYYIPEWTSDNDDYEAGLPKFMLSKNKIFSHIYNRQQNCGNAMSEITDEHFDFHLVKTYDYQISGDDPLNDKRILDRIEKGNLVRETKNPDIIFTIKKNLEGNLRMEIIALDAKRLKNKKKTGTLPVVWQMTVDRERNKNENMIDAYIYYAEEAVLPLDDRFCWQKYTLYKTSGIEIDNNRIVTTVYDDALCSFLQIGDEIIKIEAYDNRQIRRKNSTNDWTNSNRKEIFKKEKVTTWNLNDYLSYMPHIQNVYMSYKWEYRNINNYIIITFKRNGKKMKRTVRPYAVTASRTYLLNKEEMENYK